jgi:hypothetical protein
MSNGFHHPHCHFGAGERPFMCLVPGCLKTFVSSTSRSRHLKVGAVRRACLVLPAGSLSCVSPHCPPFPLQTHQKHLQLVAGGAGLDDDPAAALAGVNPSDLATAAGALTAAEQFHAVAAAAAAAYVAAPANSLTAQQSAASFAAAMDGFSAAHAAAIGSAASVGFQGDEHDHHHRQGGHTFVLTHFGGGGRGEAAQEEAEEDDGDEASSMHHHAGPPGHVHHHHHSGVGVLAVPVGQGLGPDTVEPESTQEPEEVGADV